MKKHCLLFVLLFTLSKLSLAQTSVTIIGCAHQPTSYFNAATLLQTLNQIKPDVILMELDTNLMNDKGDFLRWSINDRGNENLAVKDYKKLNNSVSIRPFDIAGRSAYYDRHNTFATENKMWKSIDSLYHDKLLSDENMNKVGKYYLQNDSLNQLSNENVYTLNSALYRGIAERRQTGQYVKTLEVVASTPQLSSFYDFFKNDGDFWLLRNQAMINNILSYIDAFQGKNIVVLTGAMHTYLLLGGISGKQSTHNFTLKDLPLVN